MLDEEGGKKHFRMFKTQWFVVKELIRLDHKSHSLNRFVDSLKSFRQLYSFENYLRQKHIRQSSAHWIVNAYRKLLMPFDPCYIVFKRSTIFSQWFEIEFVVCNELSFGSPFFRTFRKKIMFGFFWLLLLLLFIQTFWKQTQFINEMDNIKWKFRDVIYFK